MKFLGELDPVSKARTQRCNVRLRDPDRLKVIRDTGLLDTPREEAFDRLARLAAQLLDVPLTIFSLVDGERQFFKADYGLASPFKETRNLPIDASLCRYTLEGEPIISGNAPADPFLRFHPSTEPWGIVALIVLPLIHPSGHVLGTFCCIQPTPREWTDRDMTVMRELTESIMTEILLREKVARLEAEKMVRETFIAAMTHDLRTPLMASRLSVEMLGKRFAHVEAVQTAVGRTCRNLDRAERMIRDLLDASRVQSGLGVVLKHDLCNLRAVAIQALEGLAAVHGDRFRLYAEGDLGLIADEEGLRRVIENLGGNAAKYGAPGTPIEVVIERSGDHFSLRVKNEGNPIPRSMQETIFEPFRRTLDAEKGPQEGWGLGLSLVRGLAEAHGGKVSVTSSEEAGTCFTVTLPVRPPVALPETPAAEGRRLHN